MNTSIRKQKITRWGAVLVGLVALLGVYSYVQGRMNRELRDIPEAQRHALYLRTLETLRASCSTSTGPTLREYCHEQADFIMRFSECNRDCREFAERVAHTPTR